MLLGIDIGTTHCKVGLFAPDGGAVHIAVRPTDYAPDALWAAVDDALAEITRVAGLESVAAIGISSMAETGLLLDCATGEARTPFLPWFDRCAEAEAIAIARESDAYERFCRTGLRINYKSGLAKLLWLQAQGADFTGAVWLSAADYVAYRLTGAMATDPTLAARTFAFDIAAGTWDAEWLARWRLTPAHFPPVLPSGTTLVGLRASLHGLKPGIPVAVAGHDHVCAAFAAGATTPGVIFDSLGTAETLVGARPTQPLGERDYASGFIYGPHVIPGCQFWMSSLSASGGSVEWARALLSDTPLSYADFVALVAAAGPDPTGIVYAPYLAGSGAPRANPAAHAVFAGLTAPHTRAHLAKAVLEGTAYEVESMRRAAEALTGQPITAFIVAGGGEKNPHWLHIKADVSGCTLHAYEQIEATLLGAALLAGVGAGVYVDHAAAQAVLNVDSGIVYHPDKQRHARYRVIYEQQYIPLQTFLLEHAS